MAVIKVGAATETELKEKKHRIEDALSATRAAVEEGIIPGGGACLVDIIPTLDDIEAEGDMAVGAVSYTHLINLYLVIFYKNPFISIRDACFKNFWEY